MRGAPLLLLASLLASACGERPRITLRYEFMDLPPRDVVRVETRVTVASTDPRVFIGDRPYTSVEIGVGYEVRDFDGQGERSLLITHDASLGYEFVPTFTFTLLPPVGDAPPLEIRARALGAGLNELLADTGMLGAAFADDSEARLPLSDLRCGGRGLCTSNEACCEARCLDVTSDPTRCGACGEACGARGDGCTGGTCRCNGAGACAAGQTCCPGLGCIDTDTDPFHCGGCDVACAAGEVCVAGACRCGGTRCGAGQSCCDGVCTDGGCACGAATCAPTQPICCGGSDCVDLTSDSAHCGRCGRACVAPFACGGGSCKCNGNSLCGTNDTCCADGCKDLTNDPSHCGACDRRCGAGESCVGGACRCGDGGTCGGGKLCCVTVDGGRQCHDGQSDKEHCGSCDVRCATAEQCAMGQCVCPGVGMGCAAGTSCCPDKGCFDLTSDRENCGQCGKTCAPDQNCVSGQCLVSGAVCMPSCTNGTLCTGGSCFCGSVQTRCDGAGQKCCPPQSGCVDTTSDPTRCGSCTNDCVAQGKDLCCGGVCRSSADPGSCGGCGKVCTFGESCRKCSGVYKCTTLSTCL